MSKKIQEIAIDFLNTKSELSFSTLYKRLKPGLLYHANNIVKDMDAAEDIVSLSFTTIWTKIDQYNPFWNFSTWAYKIVQNESLLYMRKNSMNDSLESYGSSNGNEASKTLSENLLIKNSVNENLIVEDAKWNFDEQEDVISLVYDKVVKEIYKLPNSYKEIMIDRELNRMKYEDISEKYEMKINSVKTRIRRARLIIKNRLETSDYKLVNTLMLG